MNPINLSSSSNIWFATLALVVLCSCSDSAINQTVIRSAVQSRMYEQMPQYMSALKIHLKAPLGQAIALPQAVQATSSNSASASSFK
jgi:hypothetical protein